MALQARADEAVDADDLEAMLFEAMIALEEAMKNEGEEYPSFVDEDVYSADITIGGTQLQPGNVMSLMADLDNTTERVTEEEVAEAMKALKTVDDDGDDQVIFDTGCTAHILKST
jgi:hypothetical protein